MSHLVAFLAGAFTATVALCWWATRRRSQRRHGEAVSAPGSPIAPRNVQSTSPPTFGPSEAVEATARRMPAQPSPFGAAAPLPERRANPRNSPNALELT